MTLGAARDGLIGYEASLARASGQSIVMPWRNETDTWYLLYTSGTTASRKASSRLRHGVHQRGERHTRRRPAARGHAPVGAAVLPHGRLNLYMNR